jgi:Ca-activated chloride channel family protein
MKSVFHCLIALLVCALSAVAAAQELPSAPSASRQQAQPAPPKPQPAATTPQAAPTSAPANPPQTSPAQQQANAEDPADKKPGDEVTTIVTTVNEVPVVFTVTDKHGHYVRDLKENDFRILDDNKPPQRISAFRAETDLPLRLGLLIDASNSIRERFSFEQEAAVEFLSQVLRPRFDQAFVLGFDTTAEVSQDFTDDQEKIAKGVRAFRPGGGTALFDAVYYACHDKLAKAGRDQAVRRAIVIISDGEDNQSRYTRADAIAVAQRAEVMIYAISTNISGMKSKGDDVLKDMADQTGGRAFFPFKLQDVSSHFTDIEKELRSQYFVAYRPSDFVPDGRFRTIQIVAMDAKKYHVRARRGYYAPRQ